jgi:hypothetical protein
MEQRERLSNMMPEPPSNTYNPVFDSFLFLVIAEVSSMNNDTGIAIIPMKNVTTPAKRRNSMVEILS